MEDNELMGRMKVSKAVAKMAIPSVISSLVTVVYNMADTFFVGQTGDALQVAAVSLTNPIFILMMAFANMFGMGGSAVASMALGEQNKKRAKNVSAFVLYASFIVGIAFMLVLMIFMQPVLTLFGSDAETYEYELPAVCGACFSGYDPFDSAPGSASDTASVSAGRSVRPERRDLRTEHHRLYCGGPVGRDLAQSA